MNEWSPTVMSIELKQNVFGIVYVRYSHVTIAVKSDVRFASLLFAVFMRCDFVSVVCVFCCENLSRPFL